MKTAVVIAFCASAMLGTFGLGASARAADAPAGLPTPPPVPATKPVTETYFGTTVVDPYRYFENMKDPVVQTFFKDQNDYTRAILARLEPARTKLFDRIKVLDASGTSVSSVQRVGSLYFYLRRAPSDNNEKLVVRAVAGGDERVLVDPDKLAASAAQHFTVSYFLPSLNGKYVAYGLSEGGSENATLHVVESATGQVLPDSIDRSKFVGVTAWRPDGRSFYYMRFPKPVPGAPTTDAESRPVSFLHVLGADPEHDVPVFGFGISPSVRVEPTDFSIISYSPAAPKYTLGLVAHGVQNEVTLYVAPAGTVVNGAAPWKKVVDVADDVTSFDVRGNTLFLLTHKDAPRYKVLALDLAHPDIASARTIVPQGDTVISQIAVARDALYVRDLDGGIGRLFRLPFAGATAGSPAEVKLPYAGAISALVTDPAVAGATIGLTSWTKSLLYYALSPAGVLVDTQLKPPAPVDASAYTSTEVKAPSADGTLVPLSIVYAKDIKLDGSHPAYLEGYGAYGITLDPYFSTTRLAWLERSGVYAVCHTRGGGEYGEDWHRAGMIATKEHTIEDFVGCGKYLVDHGYTSPEHLAGEGTSAGGITIGGAVTQHPELFAAALDVVGVSDALRSEFSPNGPPNIPEFGSVTTEVGFRALLGMDALQHVVDGTKYPAIMLITGINDPRVSPWELAKFAARLQSATASGRPILLRVDYDAGHGFLAASRDQADQLLADQYSFLLWQLGDPAFNLPIRIGKT